MKSQNIIKENPSIDFIHLYFCEDILNFPNEQIFTKLNYLLQDMYSSGEFKDRDELADYCVNVLNPIAFKIARNHTEFMMYEFKNTKQKKEVINEPGEAPNAD